MPVLNQTKEYLQTPHPLKIERKISTQQHTKIPLAEELHWQLVLRPRLDRRNGQSAAIIMCPI